MRRASLAVVVAIYAPASAQDASVAAPPDSIAPSANPAYTFITGQQRVERWMKKMVGPTAVAEAAFTTGIQTMRDSPQEWESNLRGYGHRVGYRFARIAIGNTIELGVSAAMKEDPRYFHSPEPGFGRRLKHAVLSSFRARKPDGRYTFATGRFAGKLGGSFIANTWYPPSRNHWHDAVERFGVSMGFHAGFNVLKEFGRGLRRKQP